MKQPIEKLIIEIKTKLQDKMFLDHLIVRPDVDKVNRKMDSYLGNIREGDSESSKRCVHFLLKTAAELNMGAELHQLLSLNQLDDINDFLLFETSVTADAENDDDNGKTLLGITAFHGHIDLVRYLAEVKLANLNAQDMHGNTPLHQVVYGDSYPVNKRSFGSAHEEVATYLIQHCADIKIKNKKQLTPYVCAKLGAPLKIESMIGKRLTAYTAAPNYAHKVRTILEQELYTLERIRFDKTGQFFFKTIITHPIDYPVFRLEYAISQHVAKGTTPYGYPNLKQIFTSLDSLSENEWHDLQRIISSQKPEPWSFKYGIITDQLAKITKQSVGIGLVSFLLIQYSAQDILIAVLVGALSAMFAWQCLTEVAYKAEVKQRGVQTDRVNELLKHNRFFAPEGPRSLQIANLNSIERELQALENKCSDQNSQLSINIP
ncbi:MAG: ankyrin repeat domain-containing protein [Gammaproteobacteria bacterium]|nr:ankyrin repeat domain-containing protein [Gammaproteobacteria bacterium]